MDRSEHGIDIVGNHPTVVCAFRPKPGEVTHKWIHPHKPGEQPRFEGDKWNADWYEPEWYKMPCPEQWADSQFALVYLMEPVFAEYPKESHFQLNYYLVNHFADKDNRYHVGLLVNGRGDIVTKLPPGDLNRNYLIKNPDAPTLDEFTLEPWTGLKAPCGVAASQPASQAIDQY